MKSNESYASLVEMLKQFREEKKQADYIRPSFLPNIDLYMDQVTTFMDEHLQNSKRYEDDKILTKTMINNYAKNNLLPAPEKKKYTKDHLLLLTFIYYYKNFLSINDIQTLLKPITQKYFKTTGDVKLENVYSCIFDDIVKQTDGIIDDMEAKLKSSKESFREFPEDDQELLVLFDFMSTLSYDIYLKKQIVERIIDKMYEHEQALLKEQNDKKKHKKEKSE